MLNFKEWLIEQEASPILTPERDVITLGQRTPSDLSGFCLHNTEINKFALENATQMFIVFAFVLYTIQKEWQVVHHTFPNFMKWVFEEAIHKDDWDYQGTPFANLNHLMGGGRNKSKTSAPFLRELWLSKDRIFDAIKTLHAGATPNSPMSDSSEFKIFKYILNNVNGLGIVKSAFAAQLIIGKFGCIDSVNMRAYRSIIDKDIESKGKKSSFKKIPRQGKFGTLTDKAGNPVFDYEVKPSGVGLVGYVDFLQALEQIYGDNISQVLWNDWCRIVGQKIVKAGSGDKITLSVNGQIEQINPYVPKSHIKDLLDKEKLNLTQFPDPGLGVSHGHLDAIRKASEFMREQSGELIDLYHITTLDALSKIKTEGFKPQSFKSKYIDICKSVGADPNDPDLLKSIFDYFGFTEQEFAQARPVYFFTEKGKEGFISDYTHQNQSDEAKRTILTAIINHYQKINPRISQKANTTLHSLQSSPAVLVTIKVPQEDFASFSKDNLEDSVYMPQNQANKYLQTMSFQRL